MAREDPIEVIGIVVLIAGGVIYKDQILAFLQDKLGKPNPTGDCPTGQHKDSSGNCVPDGCTKSCPTGQHVDSACKNCVPDDVTSTGNKWYKANGTEKSMPNSRCDGQSNRWENDFPGGMKVGYEVVVYFSVPKGSMQGSSCKTNGSHIGLKHGGPHHTPSCGYQTKGVCGGNTCCCWWDTGLRQNGDVYVEIEHAHPNNCRTQCLGNIGRAIDNGQPLGVRWHISREGSGMRVMQWVDISGTVGANKWKQTYNILDKGQYMPTAYYSKIPNEQNVEIRISDVPCKSIKMLQGPSSRMITSGTSGLELNGSMYEEWSLIENFRLA